jgi:hypothetical protein
VFAVVSKEELFFNPQPMNMKVLHFFKLLGANPATKLHTSEEIDPHAGNAFHEYIYIDRY